ncbi:MAG: proteasome activator [Microthrixaceae bacterium]
MSDDSGSNNEMAAGSSTTPEVIPPGVGQAPNETARTGLAGVGVSGAGLPAGVVPGGAAPDGMVNGNGAGSGSGASVGDDDNDDVEVLSPAKVIRIGAMIKQLLEEARNTTVDEAAREQLSNIYNSSLSELKSALSGDLGEELDALSFDFKDGQAPTESELRMAQAQLVGWLEGLFHGIQAMMVAQQMAARQELEGARSELPERSSAQPPGPGYI